MRSVRFDSNLESRLQEVARITGESISEIIRKSAEARCDSVLNPPLLKTWGDVIGSRASAGKRDAREVRRELAAALGRKRARKNPRRAKGRR